MSNLLPENNLSLCVDFSSLSSYVALSGTRRLVDECHIEVNWLPLFKVTTRSTGKTQADDPLAEYKARRARARKMFSESELKRDCALLDISIDAGIIQYDPTPAAYGLLLLREAGASQQQFWRYVESIYSAAFREQHPVDSANKVVELLASLGIASSGYEDMSGKLKDMQAELLKQEFLILRLLSMRENATLVANTFRS